MFQKRLTFLPDKRTALRVAFAGKRTAIVPLTALTFDDRQRFGFTATRAIVAFGLPVTGPSAAGPSPVVAPGEAGVPGA